MEAGDAGSGPDRLRVVQWATGYVGMHTLKKLIQNPNLELVGLYVFSESKEGKDAGELCGLPPQESLVRGLIRRRHRRQRVEQRHAVITMHEDLPR